MFGEDGNLWKIQPSEVAERLLKWFKAQVYDSRDAFLGIYGGEQELFFLELRQVSGRWEIGRRAEEKWQRPRDFGEMAALLAERIAMRLAREGWEGLPLALCLPEAECVCKLLPIAAEIPLEEQRSAAYWEIDNYLQSCGMDSDMASFTCLRLPGEDTLETVIIFREKLRTLEEALTERNCSLAGLYPETPLLAECRLQGEGWQVGRWQIKCPDIAKDRETFEGERRCLYAAAAMAGLENIGWPENLLKAEGEDSLWNYEGIGRLAVIFFVAVMAVMLAADLGELYFASHEADKAGQELAAFESARQTMEADKKLASMAERKEACLARLSEHSRPLDSVLVHLGTVTVEGAWLTEVDCTRENAMLLQGEAVDYSALGEFMEAFERDRGFFPSLPLLEESHQKEGGTGGVEFHLKMGIDK